LRPIYKNVRNEERDTTRNFNLNTQSSYDELSWYAIRPERNAHTKCSGLKPSQRVHPKDQNGATRTLQDNDI